MSLGAHGLCPQSGGQDAQEVGHLRAVEEKHLVWECGLEEGLLRVLCQLNDASDILPVIVALVDVSILSIFQE